MFGFLDGEGIVLEFDNVALEGHPFTFLEVGLATHTLILLHNYILCE